MTHRRSRLVIVFAMTVGVLALVLAAAPGAEARARRASTTLAWAPAATATIHPGVQTDTQGNGCTSNFVFTDGAGNVYLGQAAHCAGTGAATDVDGCTAGVMHEGTKVTIAGTYTGTMVYNSWVRMQAEHQSDPNLCAFNDLALIKIDPGDVGKVNPSIPHWGGPTGLNTSGSPTGDTVYSYGNSVLRQGITLLSPKTGVSLGDDPSGWEHSVFTVTPGIPGDSGSAFLDSSGRALGILSFLELTPLPGSNGIGDIAHELGYAAGHGFNVSVVPGTEAFNPNQLPLDLANPIGG